MFNLLLNVRKPNSWWHTVILNVLLLCLVRGFGKETGEEKGKGHREKGRLLGRWSIGPRKQT